MDTFHQKSYCISNLTLSKSKRFETLPTKKEDCPKRHPKPKFPKKGEKSKIIIKPYTYIPGDAGLKLTMGSGGEILHEFLVPAFHGNVPHIITDVLRLHKQRTTETQYRKFDYRSLIETQRKKKKGDPVK